MRLWALSDLHVNHRGNLEALQALPDHGADWLIAAGDLAERLDDVCAALEVLTARFARVVWVPGNHELWTTDDLRGEAKYRALVERCRALGVLTPEDPFVALPDGGPTLCPLFLLYDYSFAPDGMTPADAVRWAAEDHIRCADEVLLHPDPWPTRQDWCAARVRYSEARLSAVPGDQPTILISHWPLRYDLVRLYRIPRFSPWCGTRHTHDWHRRFRATAVVSGHLHMRATDWRDGVRFEEVSLGYPKHWRPEIGAHGYLRQIHPAPGPAPAPDAGPIWHR
jgi:hypothetical protein